jgi:hypothetical protein
MQAKPKEQWGLTVLLMVANLNNVGLGRVTVPPVPNDAPVTHAHSFSTTIRVSGAITCIAQTFRYPMADHIWFCLVVPEEENPRNPDNW